MDLRITFLLIITVVSASFSYFLLRNSAKNKANIFFSLLSVATAAWSLGISLFLGAKYLNNAFVFVNLFYVSAALIPLMFFYFSTFFNNKKYKLKTLDYIPIVLFLVIVIGILIDKNFIILEILFVGSGKEVVLNQLVYYYYMVYILAVIGMSYRKLYLSHKTTADTEKRARTAYVIYGTLIAYIFGTIFNLFLPAAGYYQYIWIGPLSIVLMILFVSYAMVKHNLFNVKAVLTDFLVVMLWSLLFVRFFLISNRSVVDYFVDIFAFIIAIFVGTLLTRNIHKEIRAREVTQVLAEDLAQTNQELLNKEK